VAAQLAASQEGLSFVSKQASLEAVAAAIDDDDDDDDVEVENHEDHYDK
jgi:hypothetical protein